MKNCSKNSKYYICMYIYSNKNFSKLLHNNSCQVLSTELTVAWSKYYLLLGLNSNPSFFTNKPYDLEKFTEVPSASIFWYVSRHWRKGNRTSKFWLMRAAWEHGYSNCEYLVKSDRNPNPTWNRLSLESTLAFKTATFLVLAFLFPSEGNYIYMFSLHVKVYFGGH